MPLITFSFVLRGIVLIAGVRETQETFHRHFIHINSEICKNRNLGG